MSKGDIAKEIFESGYNCSQAVVLSFCEDFNIDKNTAAIMSMGLGGGVGRLREVCGAVSGMAIVLSMNFGTPDADHDKKLELYKHIQACAEKFKEENGSIVCKELLGISKIGGTPEKRTSDFYKKRPCSEIVKCAADIIENYLFSLS